MTEMHLHAFDTHKYIKELQGTGFNEAQAEIIIKSLLESREYDFSKLATRDQLDNIRNEFKAELASIRNESKAEFVSIRNEFKAELASTRNESKAEFASIRNELKAELANAQLNILKWIIPFFITIIGMIAGLFIKLL